MFHDIQMHSIMWKHDCPSQQKVFYSLTKAQQGHTAIVLGTSQNWIKTATLTKNISDHISAQNQKKKYNN